jgi:hypothetical protein
MICPEPFRGSLGGVTRRLLCGQESISGLHGQALVDHPGCDERMVVVLKTESEAMKFFFRVAMS